MWDIPYVTVSSDLAFRSKILTCDSWRITQRERVREKERRGAICRHSQHVHSGVTVLLMIQSKRPTGVSSAPARWRTSIRHTTRPYILACRFFSSATWSQVHIAICPPLIIHASCWSWWCFYICYCDFTLMFWQLRVSGPKWERDYWKTCNCLIQRSALTKLLLCLLGIFSSYRSYYASALSFVHVTCSYMVRFLNQTGQIRWMSNEN